MLSTEIMTPLSKNRIIASMIEVEGFHMILFPLTRSRKDFDLRKMVLETEYPTIIVIELNHLNHLS